MVNSFWALPTVHQHQYIPLGKKNKITQTVDLSKANFILGEKNKIKRETKECLGDTFGKR